jgi:hypothetical protein
MTVRGSCLSPDFWPAVVGQIWLPLLRLAAAQYESFCASDDAEDSHAGKYQHPHPAPLDLCLSIKVEELFHNRRIDREVTSMSSKTDEI